MSNTSILLDTKPETGVQGVPTSEIAFRTALQWESVLEDKGARSVQGPAVPISTGSQKQCAVTSQLGKLKSFLWGVPARTKHPKNYKIKEHNLPSFQERVELFITAKIKPKVSEATDDLVGKMFALQV